MGYIYKIVNDINDKVYVGKTSSTIEERWKEHKRNAKKEYLSAIRPLYHAIKKYGIENFHIEEIGEYPEDTLNDMESYWIGYYNSYKEGYNATRGGDGRQLYDYKKIRDQLLKTPFSIDVANEIGCNVEVVQKVARMYGIKLLNHGPESQRIKLFCYDKNTKELVATFSSTNEASRWCFAQGKSSGKSLAGEAYNISVASRPNSKRKTAYGYIWKTVDDLDKS